MREGSRFSFSFDNFTNKNDNSTSRFGKDNNTISIANNIKNLIRCPICKNISLLNINQKELKISFECANCNKSKDATSQYISILNLNTPDNNSILSSKNICGSNHTNSNNNIIVFNTNNNNNNINNNNNNKTNNNIITKINNNFNNMNNNNNTTPNNALLITQKDTKCFKHSFEYQFYCYDCKKNLCKICNNEHLNHNEVKLDNIKPQINEINAYKEVLNKKYSELNKKIELINKWKSEFIEGINNNIKILQNFLFLKKAILQSYELHENNSYSNYNLLQNFHKLKNLELNFTELEQFFNENDWIKKGYILINSVKKTKSILTENEYNQNDEEEKLTERVYLKNLKIGNNILEKNKTRNQRNSMPRNIEKSEKTENYRTFCLANNSDIKNIKKNNNMLFKSGTLKFQNNLLGHLPTLTSVDSKKSRLTLAFKYKSLVKNKSELNYNSKFAATIEQNMELEKSVLERNFSLSNSNFINNDLSDSLLCKIEDVAIGDAKNSNEKKLSYELTNKNIIRSIEYIGDKKIVLSTLETISIYKLNEQNVLIKEFNIQEFNYRINYVCQLKNGNIIICSLNTINIVELKQGIASLFKNYVVVQKLKGKKDSEYMNKVIEIPEKKLLISCDKKYIIIWKKNEKNNLYEEFQNLSVNTEIKCIDNIDNKMFVSVEPINKRIICYNNLNLKEFKIISNIQTSFGRYILKSVKKFNCMFVTGKIGIYLIALDIFQLIKFFRINEWISCIDYNDKNNTLICGSWKIFDNNKKKIYNLVEYQISENSSNTSVSNRDLNMKEISRKNNIHLNDITVIKYLMNNIVVTGSNDMKVKVWK